MTHRRARSWLVGLTLSTSVLLPFATPTGVAAAANALTAGNYLTAGQYLDSGNTNHYQPGGKGFELLVQSDGNIVLYAPEATGSDLGRVLWQAATTSCYYLDMQTDGDLVGYTSTWAYCGWKSAVSGSYPSSYVVAQTDGNLVEYAYGGGPVLWSTGTYHATDTSSANDYGTGPTHPGTCANNSYYLCRNTWAGPGTSIYFRAIDQFSSAHPEWATPAQSAISAWNSAPGPQFYSYSAHTNDTWVYLVSDCSSCGHGNASNSFAITWNCYASSGNCTDYPTTGTVYYTNIYFNQDVLPTGASLSSTQAALVQNVFGHESGHAMLLGHNPIESSALMWPVGQSSVTGPSSYDIGSSPACGNGALGMTCIYDY